MPFSTRHAAREREKEGAPHRDFFSRIFDQAAAPFPESYAMISSPPLISRACL